MRIIFYALTLLLFLPALVSKGQVTSHAVLLQDTTRFVSIGRRMSILEDKTARLTLAQVRQRTDFVPSYSEKFQYGYTSSAYWFRFEVTNHSQENQKHWLLGLLDAISLDYVDLYLVYPNGQVIHQQGGGKRPYVDWGFFDPAPFFRATFPTSQPVTVFVRIESSLSMYGNVTVWDEYYNLSKRQVVIFFIWLFLGLFILRSLHSFVLARFIPDPQFRFYVLCTFLFYIATLARAGVYSLFLVNYPILLNWMQYGMVRLLPLGLAVWMYSLMDGQPVFKPLRWTMLLVMGISLVGALLPLFVENAAIGEFYAILILATYALFFIGAVLVCTIGRKPTPYFVLPITLCIIPFAFYQMATLRIITYTPLINQLPMLALIIEMVVMSLVLGRIVLTYIRERIATANALMLEKVEVDKLQELGALKTRFFTNLSHELRTPLTLIISPLSELKKRFPDEPMLPMMERNSNRLLGLINQLLDMSKLEAGQLKAQPEPGDMAAFFRTLADSFQALADRRRIHFSFTQNESEYWASFDRDKVEKVVTNLLSNAFKFTPQGHEVRVDVQLAFRSVQFSVSDTGIGISTANLPYIFDRFYQVDSQVNRSYEGAGVGLALVRELVEVLQGTISVDSSEGKGTTFRVRLPLSAAVQSAGKIMAPAGIPAT
ncbi:sensor histidine kinase [Spirosoma spitsbergense]|uniref:sensor histidine kinase n=1 Tax=Spirosoma spitsbergense TaxID=431554 RepID=UPI000372D813|nr:sensor histidine kinase [Spirosoma spitsbergense]